MKILAGPDLHCFDDNYKHLTPDGVPFRLADWQNSAWAMVELAVQEQVDLAVMPGDYYPTARPSPTAQIAVANLFQELEAAGIPVIGCNGNHDVTGPGQPGPVDELATVSRRPHWGITSPQIVTAQGLQIAVLPWAKSSALLQGSESAGDLIGRTSAVLSTIVHGLAAQVDPNLPAILIGHWAISGCMTSSGMVMVGGQPALTLGDMQSGPWRAVIMGHIHKPQIFPGRPVVLHTGALERRDFGEENDERGCYIADTDTGEATWHELPVRKMHTYSMTLHIPEDLDKLYKQVSNGRATDAIVRVVYRAPAEIAKLVDHRRLRESLEATGPAHLAGIFPEIIRSERIRAEGLTETSTPEDGLETYLSQRSDLSEDLKADVRAAFQGLAKEVA